MLGFGFAFTLLVGMEEDSSYFNIISSLFTLYRAMLGDFSFDEFQNLRDLERLTAKTLLVLYLLICMIVLVNLLIAVSRGLQCNFVKRNHNRHLHGCVDDVRDV